MFKGNPLCRECAFPVVTPPQPEARTLSRHGRGTRPSRAGASMQLLGPTPAAPAHSAGRAAVLPTKRNAAPCAISLGNPCAKPNVPQIL